MMAQKILPIDLQNEGKWAGVPDLQLLSRWVKAALQKDYDNLQQTIRVVGRSESQTLNTRFRGKSAPTNILSFPAEIPYLDYQYLGDLVICAPLVIQEANQQGKLVDAHWAHLIVHGMLHLQGFQHDNDDQTDKMEALEIGILSTLGYRNPYNSRPFNKPPGGKNGRR